MKKSKWPENNAVRMFRYYQKLTVLRANPDKQFNLEIYRFSNNDGIAKQHKKAEIKSPVWGVEA